MAMTGNIPRPGLRRTIAGYITTVAGRAPPDVDETDHAYHIQRINHTVAIHIARFIWTIRLSGANDRPALEHEMDQIDNVQWS